MFECKYISELGFLSGCTKLLNAFNLMDITLEFEEKKILVRLMPTTYTVQSELNSPADGTVFIQYIS